MRVKKQKQRKILAKKICKEIFNKSGLKPYIKVVSSGYFIFSFGGVDVNLHFSFKEIPDMRFGVWTENGKVKHIFAEHESFIDKFKWTQTAFHWEDNMNAFVKDVKDWVNPDTYRNALVTAYDFDEDDEKWYHDKHHFLETHNHIEPDEYKELDNRFKSYMNNLIKEGKICSYIYTQSDYFMGLYEVCCYGGEIDGDTLYRDLTDMKCDLISPDFDFIIKKRKWSGMRKWYAVGEMTDLLCVRRAPNIEIIKY